jgi:hypothetical protein
MGEGEGQWEEVGGGRREKKKKDKETQRERERRIREKKKSSQPVASPKVRQAVNTGCVTQAAAAASPARALARGDI